MNNKGFAITGVLYTIFILFIMVLLSILAGLNTRQKLLEKSLVSFEDDYKIIDNNLLSNVGNSTIAPYTGKYIYILTSNSSIICTAYLKKGNSLDKNSIKFIEGDTCNAIKDSLKLTGVYKFE